ncbi:AMP-binding enzyme [Streptomyces sp. NPDC055749]
MRNANETASEEDLVEWCKSTMAAYKYPRLVEFRDQLPLPATGKILKRELRDEARNRA